jgi:hypothetical protein
MKTYTAVLIDVSSIQEYIFGSNKLKLNAGASFIIEHEVFGDILSLAIKKVSGLNISLHEWVGQPENLTITNGQAVEIGYIGGGNSLILFSATEIAKAFINEYSLLLLTTYPGLKISFALDGNFSLEESQDGFKKSRNRISKILAQNKKSAFQKLNVFKTGISNDCLFSNEAQEFNHQQVSGFISGEALAKLSAFDSAKDKFEKQLLSGIPYVFPANLEDISKEEEKSYIAVVHVDGNNMGNKFKACKSLPELRKLSSAVKTISGELLKELIVEVIRISEIGSEDEQAHAIQLKSDVSSGKNFLPFRPLISGGDDFTFICDGRIGVHLCEFLIKKFAEKTFGGEQLSACGGVAIVKTKYPFFRAYHLSEELTGLAKKTAKVTELPNAATLHYLIAGGGFVDANYSSIVETQFMCSNGQLLNGPYFIGEGSPGISQLKEGMRHFKKNWPSSKVKELRTALRRTAPEQAYFLATLKARDKPLKLPNGKEKLWEGEGTPFFDMIELIDFYPEPLLNQTAC